MLLDYGLHGRGAVQEIYANANAFITKSATLSKLVTNIDSLDWYSVDRDDLGDLYEDLLERNAGEKKSGDHSKLPKATMILSTAPFGTKKGGGLPTRGELTFETETSN